MGVRLISKFEVLFQDNLQRIRVGKDRQRENLEYLEIVRNIQAASQGGYLLILENKNLRVMVEGSAQIQ